MLASQEASGKDSKRGGSWLPADLSRRFYGPGCLVFVCVCFWFGGLWFVVVGWVVFFLVCCWWVLV